MNDVDIEAQSVAPTTAEPAANTLIIPPIETHVVQATRSLEVAKCRADYLLTLLQFQPRDADHFAEQLNLLRSATEDAANAYWAYVEVISCRGQA